jgi:isohexenylglutaconyl-CoA hydratase
VEKQYQTILVESQRRVLSITLNRPKRRNAMNLQMVQELIDVFQSVENDREVRAIVIRGSEGFFCAGGDINDMLTAKKQSKEETTTDPFFEMNRAFGKMLMIANQAPQAVVTILEGAVLGGGFGLACISDIAIAKSDAQFGLPETGLGIIPAQIAPFVVQRIGLTQARRLGVLGSRFRGKEAKELGVVHTVCETSEEVEQELEKTIKQICRCAPNANALTKKLMLSLDSSDLDAVLDQAAKDFSSCIRGEEGREGTKAFIEKRLPTWAEEL